MENQEPLYTKGFNNGYTLAKYEPNLLKSITPSLHPGNNYLEGMLDGKEQHEHEIIKTKLFEFDQLRKKGLDKSKEIDRE